MITNTRTSLPVGYSMRVINGLIGNGDILNLMRAQLGTP